MRRRLFRTLIIIISVGLMTGTIFSMTLFFEGVGHGLRLGTERMGADLMVIPLGVEKRAYQILITGEASEFYMDRSVYDYIRNMPEVERASPQLFVASLSQAACCATGNLLIIAIDPETDFTITPWVEEKLDRPIKGDEAIKGANVAFGSGYPEPRFFGHKFQVVGTLEGTGMGLDNSFIITFEGARTMIIESEFKALKKLDVDPNKISMVLVKLKPDAKLATVAVEIARNIRGVDVITTDDLTRTVRNQLNDLLQVLLFSGGILWTVSFIMIGAIFFLIVNERKREIGLLRSLGATQRFIFKLITTEGCLLTIIGGVLGVAFGLFILYYFNTYFKEVLRVPFITPATSYIVVMSGINLGIALLVGILASLYPAYVSSRLDPYQAIRIG
jgi:putative ABC transport system permease protein